jgi:hypothetical protein
MILTCSVFPSRAVCLPRSLGSFMYAYCGVSCIFLLQIANTYYHLSILMIYPNDRGEKSWKTHLFLVCLNVSDIESYIGQGLAISSFGFLWPGHRSVVF